MMAEAAGTGGLLEMAGTVADSELELIMAVLLAETAAGGWNCGRLNICSHSSEPRYVGYLHHTPNRDGISQKVEFIAGNPQRVLSAKEKICSASTTTGYCKEGRATKNSW